ncbi:MAG: hypothetical protein L6V93_10730 [Clostridiales bacterium]|nr:MAG: hypothetical protein L6V93_10730 [Clostridiales bacterium]
MKGAFFSLSNREQAEKNRLCYAKIPTSRLSPTRCGTSLRSGLKNLGIANDEIRARVAETSAFFGISDWFLHKNTDTLSGGQKQLFEPRVGYGYATVGADFWTNRQAVLTPFRRKKFIQAVSDLNKELGTTVILTEHRLDEALAMSDVCFAMEDGESTAHGEPRKVCAKT